MNKIRIRINTICQYNCYYCPIRAEGNRQASLSYQELLRMVQAFAVSGADRAEITGGEPLMFESLPTLVRDLKEHCGMKKVYMTTNGLLLAEKAAELKAAGIDGINVHLDTTNAEQYTILTGLESMLNRVLTGIWKAMGQHIPVTVTSVATSVSLDGLPVIAGLAKQMPVTVRLVTGCGRNSSESVMEEQEEIVNVLAKLHPVIGNAVMGEDGILKPDKWKGYITFGHGIAGAFDMEDALLLAAEVQQEKGVD